MFKSFTIAAIAASASAQQIGSNTKEQHLTLNWENCEGGQCFSNAGSVVLDANWRWLHNIGGYTNCYTGNSWDKSFCPDNDTCAQKCALDGVDQNTWQSTYGVQSNGDAMKLGFVTQGSYAKNVGSRTFLMDGNNHYKQFELANKELTFDVDVSNMPCGLNGAIYFAQMIPDGGVSEWSSDKAGANYGVGYCDAQCPHDIKFIEGKANADGWDPSPSDPNAGTGRDGSCCMEFDIWEANSISQAFTAHPCTIEDPKRCTGTECGDDAKNQRYQGVCDKDGCDFATYRNGNTDFYGPGSNFTVDTTQKFTVVTQFITEDKTANTDIVEVRRKYVQNGKTIETPKVNIGGKDYDSLTDEFCSAVKPWFKDQNDFQKKGGMKQMSKALKGGMTLVMSIWDDHAVNMLWLDSDYPTDRDASEPGVARGSCSKDSGKPEDVENKYPNSHYMISNLKFGDIDSTYGEFYKAPQQEFVQ